MQTLGQPLFHDSFSRDNGTVGFSDPPFVFGPTGVLSHGPCFPDPFGPGPNNWQQRERSITPPNSPAPLPPLHRSPSPSFGLSFPADSVDSHGYLADSSAEFQFHQSPSGDPSSESEVLQVPPTASASDPSPMDYAPLTSPENSIASKESTFSFESPVSSVKGKQPLKLQLSRKSDKVWKWVKNVFPLKRKAQCSVGQPGGVRLKEDEGCAPCCSFLVPVKKRHRHRHLHSGSASSSPSVGSGFGNEASQNGPPAMGNVASLNGSPVDK